MQKKEEVSVNTLILMFILAIVLSFAISFAINIILSSTSENDRSSDSGIIVVQLRPSANSDSGTIKVELNGETILQ